MLLHRLRRSAAGDGSGGGGGGDVIEEDVGSVAGDVGSKEDGATTQVPGMFRQPTGMHIVDREPWINECPKYANMWISRPQFLHHIRILMSLNETHGNLRALNRLFSSFDVDVEDKMNIREFCVVMENLREERKRSVWAGKSDVNPVFEAAAARFRPRDQSSHSVLGRVSHHL